MKEKTVVKQLTQFKTPEESPGYLLWHVSLGWRSALETTLKKFDLTHPQFVVLATTTWLTQQGNHVSQKDISKACGLDPNTTSQVLRGLEAKGFIKRDRTLNERSKNPQLTPFGFKTLSQALPAVEKKDNSFFQSLSSKEMVTFLKIFQKLCKTIV